MTSKNTILASNGGMNSMNTPINKKGEKNYFENGIMKNNSNKLQ